MVAYSASKAGLIGMVKAQGKEYAETGATVNALAPAVIRTAMVDAMPRTQVNYTDRSDPHETDRHPDRGRRDDLLDRLSQV